VAQALGILATALVVVSLIHYYLWRRLVRDTTTSRRARRIGAWVLVGLVGLVVLTLVGSRVFPHNLAVVLSWPGYLWIAVMFYLVVCLAVLELPRLVVRIVERSRARAQRAANAVVPEPALVGASTVGGQAATAHPEPPDHTPGPGDPASLAQATASRRVFLARTFAVSAGVAAVGLVGSGVQTALGPPQLKRVQLPLAKLPRTADGLRVALISDIHLGPLRGYSHTRRIVDMVNGLDVDIVAIVGDLVDGSVEELGYAASPLRELRSRDGAYFVTGNHEYFAGFQPWVDEIGSLGVRPLRNELVSLRGLDLAGVNDVTGSTYDDGPDFDAALAGRDPSRAVVMLAHQPIQAHQSVKYGVDLQLSGHTHGGQLVPFNLIVKATGQPVVSGLGEVDGMPVYVTNGAGFWGPPVRVGAPPDITLVELRSP
jgi:predicted MPP superfamily phosphohydrolase